MEDKRMMLAAALVSILAAGAALAQTRTCKLTNEAIPAPSLSPSLFQTATEQPVAIFLPPACETRFTCVPSGNART